MFKLEKFRKENGNLSQKQIAEILGCRQPNISAIENDNKDLTPEQYAILFEKYGKDHVMSFVYNSEEANEINEGEGLPLIPFEFIAGFGEDGGGIKLGECERYKIPEFINIGAQFLVRVGGSSMYPKYSSGDILACRKIKDDEITFFQWGRIYVIDSSQGQLIKRVCEHDDEDRIWLMSDNKELLSNGKEKYAPYSIRKDEIRSLSIVVGAVRME